MDNRIRFVALYDGHYKAKYQKGFKKQAREDEIKRSLLEAHLRWHLKEKWPVSPGNPQYSMAQYDKVNRVTIPFDEGLIMISTEKSVDVAELVKATNVICKNYFQ